MPRGWRPGCAAARSSAESRSYRTRVSPTRSWSRRGTTTGRVCGWWNAAHAYDHVAGGAGRPAAIAKAHLTDLYDRAARVATELHGGIGFTWEFDLHLWFRRAVFDRAFLGEANYHRQRAADLAGW